jgi:hypothetical protein
MRWGQNKPEPKSSQRIRHRVPPRRSRPQIASTLTRSHHGLGAAGSAKPLIDAQVMLNLDARSEIEANVALCRPILSGANGIRTRDLLLAKSVRADLAQAQMALWPVDARFTLKL